MAIQPNSLVLVAVLPEPRDLEIARLLGWYRIPYTTKLKTVNVDYVAFYQTGKFRDDQKWAINHYAAVRGHELLTRAELLRDEPDHPRAANLYFKLQLGPLRRLPDPIPAKSWRRITFFYTTGEYLLAAKEINQLTVDRSERDRLWKTLYERGGVGEASEANDYQVVGERSVVDDLAALFGALGAGGPADESAGDSNWSGLHLPERKLREASGVVYPVG